MQQNYKGIDTETLSAGKKENYDKLRDSLEREQWEEADHETASLIGMAISPKIKNFPVDTLNEIDELWKRYSNGRFGFSAQRRAL